MLSACVVRTRFILNNFSGIGLGVPEPPGPPLATPLLERDVTKGMPVIVTTLYVGHRRTQQQVKR